MYKYINSGKVEKLLDNVGNGTHSVSNLSQFKYIFICSGWQSQSIIYGNEYIPYEVFKNKIPYMINGSAAYSSFDAKNNSSIEYINDTTIKLSISKK